MRTESWEQEVGNKKLGIRSEEREVMNRKLRRGSWEHKVMNRKLQCNRLNMINEIARQKRA